MAKRINKPEQLPEWFNLERYEALLSLSVRDFMCQLERRMIKPGPHKLAKWITDELSHGVLLTCLDDLIRNNDKKRERRNEESNLAERYAVKPMSNIDLAEHDRIARWRGIYGEFAPKGSDRGMEYDGIIYDRDRAYQSVTLEPDVPVVLPVLIGLGEATDDEIVASITALLPLWRKQLHTPAPSQRLDAKAGITELVKVAEYQVIPLLDLIIWAGLEEKVLTNGLLAQVLYPPSINSPGRDANHVTQTIMPFIRKIKDNVFRDAVLLAIDNEPEVYDQKIGELISIEREVRRKKQKPREKP